jgi:hypothetical protein
MTSAKMALTVLYKTTCLQEIAIQKGGKITHMKVLRLSRRRNSKLLSDEGKLDQTENKDIIF